MVSAYVQVQRRYSFFFNIIVVFMSTSLRLFSARTYVKRALLFDKKTEHHLSDAAIIWAVSDRIKSLGMKKLGITAGIRNGRPFGLGFLPGGPLDKDPVVYIT